MDDPGAELRDGVPAGFRWELLVDGRRPDGREFFVDGNVRRTGGFIPEISKADAKAVSYKCCSTASFPQVGVK